MATQTAKNVRFATAADRLKAAIESLGIEVGTVQHDSRDPSYRVCALLEHLAERVEQTAAKKSATPAQKEKVR